MLLSLERRRREKEGVMDWWNKESYVENEEKWRRKTMWPTIPHQMCNSSIYSHSSQKWRNEFWNDFFKLARKFSFIVSNTFCRTFVFEFPRYLMNQNFLSVLANWIGVSISVLVFVCFWHFLRWSKFVWMKFFVE